MSSAAAAAAAAAGPQGMKSIIGRGAKDEEEGGDNEGPGVMPLRSSDVI
jgi:hypothetical protein